MGKNIGTTPPRAIGFGFFSYNQVALPEADNPQCVSKINCQYVLTPLPQPPGSYACGTAALATVFNALRPQQPPLTSGELDAHIRPWKNYGLAPRLMVEEARRHGLFAQAYNHGTRQDLEKHLGKGHVVVVMHRARTQYHYELVQSIGKNQEGQALLTLTNALEGPNASINKGKGFKKGFKTVMFEDFKKICWQKLKLGLYGKGITEQDPGARNAHLNIPTGHDCYYLAFSTQDDLAEPTPRQQAPWTDAPAAWANRWANRVAKALNKAMKLLGLKTLRSEWFGAFAT